MSYDPRWDLFAEGDARRDAGMAQALEGQARFHQRGLEHIKKLDKGWEGTSEDWRLAMEANGFKPPRHPSAWGALAGSAFRVYHYIEPTGEMRKPKDPTSHSREIKVWRRT